MRNRPGLVTSYNKDADLRNFAHWGDDEKTRIAEDYTPPVSRLQTLREANQSFTQSRSARFLQVQADNTFHARLRNAGF